MQYCKEKEIHRHTYYLNKYLIFMNTRNKSILIFVAGIITGFILTILLALILRPRNTDENLQLFEKPTQEIKANSFRVMQVLPDGSALAMVDNISRVMSEKVCKILLVLSLLLGEPKQEGNL